MSKKKLFLLDAYALIYRSYYAFIKNPRVNSKGMNTSAIFGFVNTLEEVLRKENPTHIGVAFDPPGPTFRHTEYAEYKAQREATPEDIKLSVPYIKQIIEAYNIPILEVMGYEADDVIGTIAKQVDKEVFDVYMMTPDKDYGQLTEPHVFIYKPKYGSNDFDLLNDQKVVEKYGLSHPCQVIDLLGLMGDTADNIPGCPGVGEKTAIKLLTEFGSIDNLLLNTDKLKGAIKKKVEENAENIRFSKFLATIKTDVPIEIDVDALERKPMNSDSLRQVFDELEFRTLLKRILNVEDDKSTKPVVSQPSLFDVPNDAPKAQSPSLFDAVESTTNSLSSVPHTYQLIETEQEMTALCNTLMTQQAVCFDTETTSLDTMLCELVGIAFCYTPGEAYYVALSPNREEAQKQVELFRPFFENDQIEKVGHNLKYDISVMLNYAIEVRGELFDTMLAHYLINPDLRHGMDYLAETYLNYTTIKYEEVVGKSGKQQKTMRDVSPQEICDYACEDADITLQLKQLLAPQLTEHHLNDLFRQVECPLIRVLANMERTGVRLDLDALAELSAQLNGELQALEQEIMEMAGKEFNVNSPRQIGEVLFDDLKLVEKAKKTKTGQYSTSEAELEKLKGKHPIVDKILEQRGVKKLLSTYIDAFPLLVNPHTGKVHTSFNQAVAATGRLSSTNPNLQNIPIRDERGKEMRKVFIPDEGCIFVSADYSQIELRIMAHLSQDKNMIEAFAHDQDIHAATAAKIYHLPIDEVTSDMRRKAKTANFGIIYGISAFGLSERLSIPRGEAKELIDEYFNQFDGVKTYMADCIEKAREKGYVETLLGRKRYLSDINSRNAIVRGYAERNAINAPIQGTAADIIKVAMIAIHRRMKQDNLQSKMILQVHDELNFNVVPSELDKMTSLIREEMESAIALRVPLKTDVGQGKNWLEAH